MFDKNVFLRDTLRLVTAEIKRFEVDNRVEATDDDLVNILKKMAKQRKDSIQQYADGGRPDLEEVERNELDVLEKYLPQALSGDALKTAIQEIISLVDSQECRIWVMDEELRSKHPNAEMSEASSFVKELLS